MSVLTYIQVGLYMACDCAPDQGAVYPPNYVGAAVNTASLLLIECADCYGRCVYKMQTINQIATWVLDANTCSETMPTDGTSPSSSMSVIYIAWE